MDFRFNKKQEMLRATPCDPLEEERSMGLVRGMEEDDRAIRQICSIGRPVLVVPNRYGDSEGDFLELIVLLEQMGRALVPYPCVPTVALGALRILSLGTEDRKNEFLP